MHDVADIDPSLHPIDNDDQCTIGGDVGRYTDHNVVSLIDSHRRAQRGATLSISNMAVIDSQRHNSLELVIERTDQTSRERRAVDLPATELVQVRSIGKVLAGLGVRPAHIATKSSDHSNKFPLDPNRLTEHPAKLSTVHCDEVVGPFQRHFAACLGDRFDGCNPKRGRNHMRVSDRDPRHKERDEKSTAGRHLPATVTASSPSRLFIGEQDSGHSRTMLSVANQIGVRRARNRGPRHLLEASVGGCLDVHGPSVSHESLGANSH